MNKLIANEKIRSMLDDEQLAAVESPLNKNTVVRAVAGSGKTRALTARVASVISHGIDPSSILLLTFTNKAASEMKERISDLLGGSFVNIQSGTFHSVAVTHLKRYSQNRSFSILDEDDKASLMKTSVDLIIEKENLSRKEFYTAARIAGFLSQSINHNITVKDVMDQNGLDLDTYPSVMNVINDYIQKKDRMNLYDFDDLIVEWMMLLENKSVKKSINDQFKYVFIDEYQDINWIQDKIIHSLIDHNPGASLFAIGDSSQCIYQFRGSKPAFIEEFENEYPNVEEFTISTNYRSVKKVLAGAEDLINHNNLKRLLRLNPATDEEGELSYRIYNTDEDQARLIVNSIKTKVDKEDYDNVAILVRTRREMYPFRKFAIQENLPVKFWGLLDLKKSKHAKDYISLISILINDMNFPAFQRYLTTFKGIGSVSAESIYAYYHNNGRDIDKLLDHFAGVDSVVPALKIIKLAKEYISNDDKDDPMMIPTDMYINSYKESLKGKESTDDIILRVEEITTIGSIVDAAINSYEGDRFEALSLFLEEWLLDSIEEDGDSHGKVQMMTIHQSKGLEWDKVYIVNLNFNLFPKEDVTTSEREAERNLMYVAMTRARKSLHLSYAKRSLNGLRSINVPSSFITEMQLEETLLTMDDFYVSQDDGRSGYYEQ